MNKLALSILSFSASSESADSEIIDRITLNENLNRVKRMVIHSEPYLVDNLD